MKIAVVDPGGELNHVYQMLGKIKVARAKIVVICTRKPNHLLLTIILQAFYNLKCLNGIVVYQYLGKIYVYTVNPFLPENEFVIKLKATDDIFYNKLKDVMGYKVNALFTFEDRTKANSKRKKNKTVYIGKDYDAISTIFTHMNATLNIIHVTRVLMDNETNPWINSNQHTHRLEVKKRVMHDYNISVVIHSQPFLNDDGITENTYPHAQDDDCVLTVKGTELSLQEQLINIFTMTAWMFYLFACLGMREFVFLSVVSSLTATKLF